MQKLYTAAGETPADIPWNSYPRPQMVRKDWLCLNGKWFFEYGDVRTEITVQIMPIDESMEQERKGSILTVKFYPLFLCSLYRYTAAPMPIKCNKFVDNIASS